MKIAFVVNELATCSVVDTTVGMGLAACNRKHEVYFIEVGDGIYQPDGKIHALGVKLTGSFKKIDEFLPKINQPEVKKTRIDVEDLDVLYLRNNPSEDMDRPWAKFSGILFGQFSVKCGVLVLNHPDTLAYAHVDKMYFEQFPEAIRPASVITRNMDDIRHFYKEHKQKIILKPLEGSGGKDVFLVDKNESNMKQIVEAISRNGYVIAQEYLPEAKNGDIRVFMVNGKPFKYKGEFASFRRVNDSEDIRSNLHAGGKSEKFEMTDKMLEIADILRPKFVQDGIFCAGLDVVGDKLIELNITSPGGLNSLSKMVGVDFNEGMIVQIERKLEHRKHYGSKLSNKELAVME